MIGAVFLVLAFVVLLRQFAVVGKSGEVFTISRRSLEVLRDPDLSDLTKEKTIQAHAKQMIGLFFTVTVRGAASVLIPIGVLWIGDRLGWLSLADVFSAAVSPGFLIVSGLFALVAILLPTRN